MYSPQTFYKLELKNLSFPQKDRIIILLIWNFVKKKKNRGGLRRRVAQLLSAERLAVSTLVLSGIHLVGTYLNALQRAVICGIAMIGTLLNAAGDALVCMIVHVHFLL